MLENIVKYLSYY